MRSPLLAVALMLAAPAVQARDVELTAFGGIQYSAFTTDPHFGGTLSVDLDGEWRVDVLYSRQPVGVPDGVSEGYALVAVERYLGAIQQQTGMPGDKTRFFGLGMLGATRFQTASRGSEAHFTAGVALGIKHVLSRGFGFRVEAHGYYVSGATSAVGACSGGCVLAYSGTGNWEGNLSGGLTLRF
jgi:hypothetical protein